MFEALEEALRAFCHSPLVPPGSFLSFEMNVRALLAVVLVSLICGAVGSLVVGNRMAFFSDALAHTAFAGVALGLLLGLVTGATPTHFGVWITLVMVVFGVLVGLAIAFVREKSGQASDTIIGVFFAGAIGLGAILLKAASKRNFLPPEDFLFGNLVTVELEELLLLLALALVTAGVLAWRYNQIVFTSFSPPLAQSRQISVRFCNYLLIVLLALIVNICLRAVGALLINALLVVPAATAANLCRNMRQLFRWSMLLCLAAGLGGQWLSWQVNFSSLSREKQFSVSEGGMIVLLSVLLFFASLLAASVRRGRGSPALPRAGGLAENAAAADNTTGRTGDGAPA
jgi:zinc transport system permease protein